MTANPTSLDVYYGNELTGTIHDTSPISFEYSGSWLDRPARLTIAAIPLGPGRNDSPLVQACFENLLPEGELRDHLSEQRKASTVFSLLLEVAGDTAGGFVIVPGGRLPAPAAYEPTSWEAIATRLKSGSSAALDLHGDDARISLAGAQDKTGIAIFEDGVPQLPLGTSPSTHILKPNIRRLNKVWHSAVNETIVMRAASHCGLPTAEVFYEPLTEACVVKRFDRTLHTDGTLARLIQYDMCQLAGTLSDRKYEKEGGPGLAACAELIRRYSTQSAVDLRHLVGWIFFNLYVGNNDSHAKNLSIYNVPGKGTRLTPFYDLMCTRLYPGLAKDFAFQIGGEYKPGTLEGQHLTALGEQLGMRPVYLATQAADMARRVPDAIRAATHEVTPSLSSAAQTMSKRLEQFVLSTTKKAAARFAG